ncbi:MAG TPA: hypothetical protein VF271_08845 [Rhodanobacteraceae bacterium]
MSRFTIALSGLAEADATAFAQALAAGANPAWRLTEETPAWLLVVDIDTVWGHMDWLRATANGQLVVALTKDEQVRGCDLVLHRPINATELSTLLQGIEHSAGTGPAAEPASSTDAIPTPAPVAAPTVDAPQAVPVVESTPSQPLPPTPDPVPVAAPLPSAPEAEPDLTIGQALLHDRITQLLIVKSADGNELTLDPERGGYTGPAKLKDLKPLLDKKLSAAQRPDVNTIARLRQSSAQPLTRLLWFAALTATPGKLSASLDENARYRLTRWPQIEREFPRHFRIATAMMKGASSLGDIASAANAPIADVADFINAYSVAGYVAGEATEAPESTNGGGMFSRLRRSRSNGDSHA